MRFGAIVASSVVLLTAVGAASAVAAQNAGQTRAQNPTVSLNDAQAAGGQRLQLNANGRWSLNLNTQSPVGRDADWSEVEAGAYYRLSPRLRVGAAAGLAATRPDPARPAETDRSQPRVRLETIFKF